MKRKLSQALKEWKNSKTRKPLLIRGARQVGKSYLVENFGQESFDNLVTVNLEYDKELKEHFAGLDPKNILDKLFLLKGEKVEPGKSLLFIDEIQECPEAIVSLRYFYEKMPDLHVIAAGSLLDFMLNSQEISIPVGRIHYLYLEPLSFSEYLIATANEPLDLYIKQLTLNSKVEFTIHNKLIELFKNYLILGGMPAVLFEYVQNGQTFPLAFREQGSILDTYRDDFKKYGRKSEQKYLKAVFGRTPFLLSKKYIYSQIDIDYKSRDIKNAYNLLSDANIVKKIKKTSPQSLPLEALASEKHFKSLFLDCGLAQNILGTAVEHIVAGDFQHSAAGGLAEQYVGQELVSMQDPYRPKNLYYWEKGEANASAEIDYLLSIKNTLVPIEVKAGSNRRFKSLRVFMNQFHCKFGVKVSQEPLGVENDIVSIPFYALSQLENLLPL